MNTKTKLARLNISLIIALILAIVVSPFSTFAKECNQIRQSVLRLHIIPNSDSTLDQNVKLLIRDRVLKLESNIFEQASDINAAKDAAINNIDNIKEIAQTVLIENGLDQEINIEICKMFFETRYYENFTLPAGKYDAIRITIGEAKGSNWWCVMYPPLCVPAATKKEQITDEELPSIQQNEQETGLDEVLTKEQNEIVKGKAKYEVRFASVELIEKLKKLLFD